jgi:hypothetical protein
MLEERDLFCVFRGGELGGSIKSHVIFWSAGGGETYHDPLAVEVADGLVRWGSHGGRLVVFGVWGRYLGDVGGIGSDGCLFVER